MKPEAPMTRTRIEESLPYRCGSAKLFQTNNRRDVGRRTGASGASTLRGLLVHRQRAARGLFPAVPRGALQRPAPEAVEKSVAVQHAIERRSQRLERDLGQ